MGQAKTNKMYRTYVRGLITEASPLTYPEDSSLDELNTVPSRRGNRTRRLGINFTPSDFVENRGSASSAKSEFIWSAVGNNPALTFLVAQGGTEIRFFDRSTTELQPNEKSFSINLSDHLRPNANFPQAYPVKFASGKGYLFIVQQEIEPLVVTYDLVTDSISVTQLAILARDFEGIPDYLQNDEEPSELRSYHFYNLMNQGWISPKS